MTEKWKHWRVAQVVELGATAKEVWDLIGGFYTLHKWHPDIHLSEVPPDQTETAPEEQDERDGKRQQVEAVELPRVVHDVLNEDGDALIYSGLEGPTGLSVTPSGLVTWTPGSGDVGTHAVLLQVIDSANNDSGTIVSWSITVTTGEAAVTSGALGTYQFTNVPSNGYAVRQILPAADPIGEHTAAHGR